MKKVLSILAFISLTFIFTACDKSEVSKDGKTITIQPSWSEAFHYANASKSSQIPFTILAVVLLAGSAFLFIKVAPKQSDPKGIFILGAILLALACGSYFGGKPSAVRISNTPVVDKSYYDKVGQKYILDSLFDNNLMINANSK